MNNNDTVHTYTVSYSTGTNHNNERRYIVHGIKETSLGGRIATMTAQGKVIYEVKRETSF